MSPRRISLVLLALLVVASVVRYVLRPQRDAGYGIVVTSSTCLTCRPPASTGALAGKELDETSGVVARSFPGDPVYYVHNDSGDTARFFAIDASGKRLATYTFSSDAVVDCEDMARGPCEQGDAGTDSCLYVGDIGDNLRRRDGVVVYRMREPEAIADATLPSTPLRFRYPDGPHDAETLLVHPKTGDIVIVTKEKKGASTIFQAPTPLTPGAVMTLRAVGTVAAPAGSHRFSGGSVHPEAKGILLRTYTHAYYAPMRPDQSIAEALRAPLCSVPVANEEQGEAIGWTRSADGFVTVGEGEGSPVYFTRCDAR